MQKSSAFAYMPDYTYGHGLGVYRQAALRTTLAAALVLLIPFGVFYVVVDRRVLNGMGVPHRPLLDFLIAAIVLGLALAIGFGRFVSRHIRTLSQNLDRALFAVEQRERERDSAQQELIKKLEAERELVKQRVQFEAQLAEYEKYAALAQLALGAAHEINNPLLGILSHLELELRSAEKREDRVEIEQCIEGTKRISSTIRALLNYARPGPLQLSRVSVERLVLETIAFVSGQPLFRKVHFEKHISPIIPTITADANQLSQVLVNLLLNAAQAMSDGGTIVVIVTDSTDDGSIEITVSDNGPGIPADILPHIFEPFFTTKRGKGTGLGLSITQSYIRNHGGTISVESTGRGTSVRFTLPVELQTPPQLGEAAQEIVV